MRIHKRPGWLFGDVALLFNSQRSASVVATTAVTLWALGRRAFLRVRTLPTETDNRSFSCVSKLSAGIEVMLFAVVYHSQAFIIGKRDVDVECVALGCFYEAA